MHEGAGGFQAVKPEKRNKGRKIFLIIAAGLLLLGAVYLFCQRQKRAAVRYPDENLAVTSTAFENGGPIPKRYTGRGEDVSPELSFGPLSGKAESIAIVMDDLDHPIGMYNHWVLWNIPASFASVPENVPRGETVTTLGNAVQGRSEYGGKHFYRGPLPPFGTHRYVFRVYVLDMFLSLDAGANKTALLTAMEGHILQYGTLTGSYGN
jgi:Raf kinase inhibitor-like YbhB/YbcL family protein